MPLTFDAALLTGWVRASTQALERHCAEIDRINVFPVPDCDTGTNLLLTMRAAGEAARRARDPDGPGLPDGPDLPDAWAVAAVLARGALLGARGNSGVILSQLLRGVAEAVGAVAAVGLGAVGAAAAGVRDGTAPTGGTVLADALVRASRLATASISRPKEGTVLTVLAAAAAAAGATGSDRLDVVALAAADSAASALAATTAQLPELARAGVVDAGGLGLYLVLDALAGLATGRTGGGEIPGGVPAAPPTVVEPSRDAHEYEVMYLLDDSDPEEVDVLRATLDAIGDSVVVVGDGNGTWNVHVHCTDIGASIEAGIRAGRPNRITVVRFADQIAESGITDGRTAGGRIAAEHTAAHLTPVTGHGHGHGHGHGPGGRFARDRAVLMVVTGAEVAELARSAGADVVQRSVGGVCGEAELREALAATRARHVVLLPDDEGLIAAAERAAAGARAEGQQVQVVPTAASVPQGLAALAVHDPDRHPDDDVVAMAEAAAGTRTAGLLVAASEALTWVGRCEAGDVLGISDGEVLLIAPDLAVGALWLAHRMLLAGGEIVTALLGQGVEEALGEGLAADLRRTHPEIDVVVLRGGQTDYPLVLGVE